MSTHSRSSRFAALIVPVVLLAVAGCRQPAPEPVPEAVVARAQQALQPFKEELFLELRTALEEGPEHAVHICSERAREIAAAHATGGVEMGRTSHRLRNPANAPRPWVEPLLAAAVESPEEAEPVAVWVEEGSRVGYVEPIRVRAMCVSCHGPAVDEGLLAEIREAYPRDEAVGFRAGDLRGLFWVEMPAPATGS